MAKRADELRAHFDSRAASYSEVTPWVNDPVSLRPIGELVAAAKPRRVLELGVGSGALPNYLRSVSVIPTSYIGLDISAAMLRQATGWLPVQADASLLPLPSRSIDLAIARQSFHYFEDPSSVLGETRRVLTPGGTLLVAQITPFNHPRDVEWWSVAISLRQPLRRHLWTQESLQIVLHAHGFDVGLVAYVEGRSSLCNWMNRYPIDSRTRDQLMNHYRQAPTIVRALRNFSFGPEGCDVEFSICWTLLAAQAPGGDAQHA